MPKRKRTDGDRWREIAAAFFRYDETGKHGTYTYCGLCYAMRDVRRNEGLPDIVYESPAHKAIYAFGWDHGEHMAYGAEYAALRGMYALLLAEVADDTHDTYTYEENVK